MININTWPSPRDSYCDPVSSQCLVIGSTLYDFEKPVVRKPRVIYEVILLFLDLREVIHVTVQTVRRHLGLGFRNPRLMAQDIYSC